MNAAVVEEASGISIWLVNDALRDVGGVLEYGWGTLVACAWRTPHA